MAAHRFMEVQGIARSNYSFKHGKARINVILSAILMVGLIATIFYL